MRKMASAPDKYSLETRYAFAKKAIHYMIGAGNIETIAYGQENLPKEGGYVLFPNHQGKYDALGIIYTHERPCSFVMDKAKSYTFLVKEFLELIDGKRISLYDLRQGMHVINSITQEVIDGRIFILFSEGGYSHNRNKVQDFKPGSFKSAQRAKAPIVPVCLIDSYKPFNSFTIGKITTKVIYLEPLTYSYYQNLNTTQIAAEVKQRITSAMNEFGENIL